MYAHKSLQHLKPRALAVTSQQEEYFPKFGRDIAAFRPRGLPQRFRNKTEEREMSLQYDVHVESLCAQAVSKREEHFVMTKDHTWNGDLSTISAGPGVTVDTCKALCDDKENCMGFEIYEESYEAEGATVHRTTGCDLFSECTSDTLTPHSFIWDVTCDTCGGPNMDCDSHIGVDAGTNCNFEEFNLVHKLVLLKAAGAKEPDEPASEDYILWHGSKVTNFAEYFASVHGSTDNDHAGDDSKVVRRTTTTHINHRHLPVSFRKNLNGVQHDVFKLQHGTTGKEAENVVKKLDILRNGGESRYSQDQLASIFAKMDLELQKS